MTLSRSHITRMYMFAILDKAKPDIENIRDLNLAVARNMTVQVIKLVLQPDGIICCTSLD
jgi:hypothetical protein